MTGTLALIEPRLRALAQAGQALTERFEDRALQGRTRMQDAQEITLKDRVQSWCAPVEDHLHHLAELRPLVRKVQIGGAVGDRKALGSGAEAVVEHVARALSLTPAPQWHAQRGGVARFAGLLSGVTGTLGKMGQDLALMAQMGELRIAGAGGSSAMPHKQNPVQAELLVTLARFNATQIAGIHQAMVHEQERSGAAWALEWMILPQMAEATGRALTVGTALLHSIEEIGAAAR
jgi:3-carboxy-cis,cis-muconate cycloisomerase